MGSSSGGARPSHAPMEHALLLSCCRVPHKGRGFFQEAAGIKKIIVAMIVLCAVARVPLGPHEELTVLTTDWRR